MRATDGKGNFFEYELEPRGHKRLIRAQADKPRTKAIAYCDVCKTHDSPIVAVLVDHMDLCQSCATILQQGLQKILTDKLLGVIDE